MLDVGKDGGEGPAGEVITPTSKRQGFILQGIPKGNCKAYKIKERGKVIKEKQNDGGRGV